MLEQPIANDATLDDENAKADADLLIASGMAQVLSYATQRLCFQRPSDDPLGALVGYFKEYAFRTSEASQTLHHLHAECCISDDILLAIESAANEPLSLGNAALDRVEKRAFGYRDTLHRVSTQSPDHGVAAASSTPFTETSQRLLVAESVIATFRLYRQLLSLSASKSWRTVDIAAVTAKVEDVSAALSVAARFPETQALASLHPMRARLVALRRNLPCVEQITEFTSLDPYWGVLLRLPEQRYEHKRTADIREQNTDSIEFDALIDLIDGNDAARELLMVKHRAVLQKRAEAQAERELKAAAEAKKQGEDDARDRRKKAA